MSDIENTSKETINRLIELGGNLAVIQNPTPGAGLTPYAIIPDGCEAKDLSEFFPLQRIKQIVTLLEVGSFIDYVNRYKTADTLIFANVGEKEATFRAVLDYHSPEGLKPAYNAHQAVFTTMHTPEFKAWMGANRKAMSQVEFATWLEDNAKLFTEPTGADLLEIVETLYGKQDVRFTSAHRLQSGGNKFDYDEDVTLSGNSTARAGTIELPKEITALFPIFQGSAGYVVRARLKYRIESRKLSLWFETIALPDIMRHAILSLVTQISQPTTVGEQDLSDGALLRVKGTGIVPLLGSI